jgi:two-component system OmpR family sensor kinase
VQRRRPTIRLFWKLLLALYASMIASFVGTSLYFWLFGEHHAERHGPPLILGLFPSVPLASGAVVILVTGLLLAWYLTRPLRHLGWALREMQAGRLHTRVSPLMGARRDEITDLAHDFDGMAARLEHLTESRQVLLHDISHELRSPLGRMQAAIGLMRQSPDRLDEMVQRIEREAGRMDTLLEELLTLHRLESGPLPAGDRSRVDLVELLEAIVEDANFEAQQVESSVELQASGRFVTAVNGELIYRAFENVVRNAVKYTAHGTLVSVRAASRDDGRTLVVTVKDRGPGVPRHLLQAMFDPFVRVEGSEHVRGVGLGLAIARRAILLHEGRVEARPREGGGLEVEFHIPCAQAND